MRWEVFRQEKPKDYHSHVGDVHAPNAELATQYAQIMHARRKPANSLWVVPKEEIETVDADEHDVAMGGLTQKEYRWATNYSTGEMAEEIEESEAEQKEAEDNRKKAAGEN
ncbi:phenylacetic acid degradation protein PaaB [Natronomonas salina]|uniref:phenylacetic acid degradation protein PaaB n=1 Tax=Natronomonas salina TaxID=1710540 RepID=UPI0015B3CC3F|nr:phenylacetic acid degradation protein PaaB [Natronomonas salina]QLD88215.1 phenylacetic acid degradation protein PaaB [Natronomonas salina]